MERITTYLIQSTVKEKGFVRVWSEKVNLPTYAIGKEEKNPIFLEKRVYQASSGSVYPYPVVEKISDIKADKVYDAYFLENYYIKIMILPELGGRVQMAYDKIKKRHFVYYNQVVKPALVGLTGPWISGGIEFNWPQHHRPSTFLPTDVRIEENADGSKTVWCGEVERMCCTKGMQGFTLYPDKAYIEIKVQLYNRTPFPQTFLWWANPAVPVNDHYYSVFPPDVNAVFDHGKRAVTAFPISKSVYYKHNYAPGTDISRYKNIPVPTSYMAVLSKYDFVGGYDEQAQGGLLHVADHHISPGKKQWTWGNCSFGQAWDRNLTDEDGPYIELMTGMYCDNQPDFSWLQPYEEKSWTQYFMPYAEVGYVKNANKDVLLYFNIVDNKAKLIVYTTGEWKNVHLSIDDLQGKSLWKTITDISPERVYETEIPVQEITLDKCCVTVTTADGKTLLTYQAEKKDGNEPIPDPAKTAKEPQDITSIEQLYLTGHHLEQYHHATYNPMDYYKEALRREQGDIRCNNAVGLLLLRQGQFQEAEQYFRRAITTVTERNPNPYDGEPYYNLGVCLRWQGKTDEAYDAFFKSTWNGAWQDAAYFAVAQIDVKRRQYQTAVEHADLSLIRNWHNHKARQLKASALRLQGRGQEALNFVNESLQMDVLNVGCWFEKYLLTQDTSVLENMLRFMRGTPHDFLEYALDYMAAGLYTEAEQLLSLYVHRTANVYPMVQYALACCADKLGKTDEAVALCCEAESCNPDYCFPNRPEEVLILELAIQLNPKGAKAYYYLGNFWYSKHQYKEAIVAWEHSAVLDDSFPTVFRNLALAYYNKRNDKVLALQMIEKAFALDKTDARIFMELYLLYKKTNKLYKERLALLEKYRNLMEERDDMYIEYIQLINQLERYEDAKCLAAERKFHPWEGGEGKITNQYVLCRLELAKQALSQNDPAKALALLLETEDYPHNLGEGKLTTMEENDIDYYKALAYRGVGELQKAEFYFRKATMGSDEPQQAFYYNDSQPDKIYYQALAWIELKNPSKAEELFKRLIKHGEEHLNDHCKIDYFAVSLPELAIWDDNLDVRNQIHCHYVMGLGYLGLGDKQKAAAHFREVQKLDINHQGSQVHLKMC